MEPYVDDNARYHEREYPDDGPTLIKIKYWILESGYEGPRRIDAVEWKCVVPSCGERGYEEFLDSPIEIKEASERVHQMIDEHIRLKHS